MGKLKLNKALSGFKRADTANIDCGEFDVVIRQVASHNQAFRAKAASFQARSKGKIGIGNPNADKLSKEDAEFFIEAIFVGWGPRPLTQDDDKAVEATGENLMEIFHEWEEGKVLCEKLIKASMEDSTFKMDETIKNSPKS